ncbi:hypothetical protein [Pectobacterium colocasium]|uniref:hypothetical protein n=1 Tax=Pectobacterium colocasium TaxID=2878098 RepID=UPI003D651F60
MTSPSHDATQDGKDTQCRILEATLGYFAFLVGPPALGFLGEVAGVRIAMLRVLAMVFLAFICSSSARERSAKTVSDTPS